MAGTFFYDGDCAFCSRCAAALVRWVPTTARVRAWQRADIAAYGLTAAECGRAVQWVEAAHRSEGPAAVAAFLRSGTRPVWRGVGRVLATRAALVVSWPVYRWVARHRHQLPGGTEACALPIDSYRE